MCGALNSCRKIEGQGPENFFGLKHIARLFKDSLRAFVAVGFNFARSVATGGPTASRSCENWRVPGAGAAPNQ